MCSTTVLGGVVFPVLDLTRSVFQDAICWAINPLAVGMTLSLQLEGAAGLGNEGLRQISARLQKEVEDLVLEVFERLPHTVDGLESEDDDALGGMEASGETSNVKEQCTRC